MGNVDNTHNSSVSSNKVDNAIKKLKNKTTCGQDSAPSDSVTVRVFPTALKNPCITEVHKSGVTHYAENYRPISILYNVSKSCTSPDFVDDVCVITNFLVFQNTLLTRKNFRVDVVYLPITDLPAAFKIDLVQFI